MRQKEGAAERWTRRAGVPYARAVCRTPRSPPHPGKHGGQRGGSGGVGPAGARAARAAAGDDEIGWWGIQRLKAYDTCRRDLPGSASRSAIQRLSWLVLGEVKPCLSLHDLFDPRCPSFWPCSRRPNSPLLPVASPDRSESDRDLASPPSPLVGR